jgi:hypothetical protein
VAYFKGQGGRPKGAKNKRTDLHAKCEKIGVDVFEELLTLAHGEPLPDKRFHKFMKLAEYLYAKPKEAGEIDLTPDQVRELIREWTENADRGRSEGAAG